MSAFLPYATFKLYSKGGAGISFLGFAQQTLVHGSQEWNDNQTQWMNNEFSWEQLIINSYLVIRLPE